MLTENIVNSFTIKASLLSNFQLEKEILLVLTFLYLFLVVYYNSSTEPNY